MTEGRRKSFISASRTAGFIICIFAVALFANIPGQAADGCPKILKIVHRKIANGDSFSLTADQPFPKEFISSRNSYIEIEFNGMDCALPRGSHGTFATPVKSDLTNRLDVNVSGSPPRSIVKFGLRSQCDYSYTLVKHSPRKLEIRLTCYKYSAPGISTDAISFPPPPEQAVGVIEKIEEPPEVKPDTSDFSLITKIIWVKHFKLDDDSDRIEFTFDGKVHMPETMLRKFPESIELRFPATVVKYSSRRVNGVFTTAVPGRLIDKMRVWNPDSPGEDCIFRFNVKGEKEIDWDIVRRSDNKVVLEIRPVEKIQKPTAEWDDIFTMKPDRLPWFRNYARIRLKTPELSEPDAPREVISIPAIELEINWPVDADVLAEQITMFTSKIGLGFIVDLTLDLRLHLVPDSYREPHPDPRL